MFTNITFRIVLGIVSRHTRENELTAQPRGFLRKVTRFSRDPLIREPKSELRSLGLQYYTTRDSRRPIHLIS